MNCEFTWWNNLPEKPLSRFRAWLKGLWRSLKCRWGYHDWKTTSLLESGKISQTTYRCKNCLDSFTVISYGWMNVDDAAKAVVDTIEQTTKIPEKS